MIELIGLSKLATESLRSGGELGLKRLPLSFSSRRLLKGFQLVNLRNKGGESTSEKLISKNSYCPFITINLSIYTLQY
jgi:hypothetical protein